MEILSVIAKITLKVNSYENNFLRYFLKFKAAAFNLFLICSTQVLAEKNNTNDLSFYVKNELIEIFRLRTKFHAAMVSCSRYIWITNSIKHRRIWTANHTYMTLLTNPVDHKG